MRNAIAMLLYVASAFFFYTIAILAFISLPPVMAKLAIMGIFVVPALGFLLGGLKVSRSLNWQHHSGIVLLSGAAFAAFVTLNLACMIATPEIRQMFSESKLDYFSDYLSGGLTIASLATAGAVLLWRSRVQRPAKGLL